MQEAVLFLSKNPEILEKVKEGTASLIGVTHEELKAIIDSIGQTEFFSYWTV